MPALPTGTVTFLCTDIEGSTRLVRELGDAISNQIFAAHRRLLVEAVESAGGTIYQDQGESFVFAFHRAKDAVLAAIAAQRALAAHSWPEDRQPRVRMGVHSGEPMASGKEYVGLDVHKAARICSAGHGGQILLSLTTRELVGEDLSTGLGLRDLGEHRLKDLTRPQRLFQILAGDLPADFPPLKSLDVLPNNLPIHLTSFIGREREKAEVRRLLSATRLLTLTGSGGAGKTRLALQVAAELLEEFRDGVWVVELASVSDPALVAKEVASAMKIPEQPGRPLNKTLEDYLQPRSLLLLLDNCEHLVSACANLVETLLRATPHLRILVTSREALGIEGETTYRVPSLSLPDALTLPLERMNESEAVKLFIDRATAALPSFVLAAQNARAVATICQQLDGIPLAIELAAAKVKSLSVEQIAKRLDDRFGLLASGRRTALPRQQTLRATMDWSYDLLSEPERAVLRRLSAFAGGFTVEGAEAVCQGVELKVVEIVDLLTRLVEKSLVVYEEGNGRYRLLETVRQYGHEKLGESGEESKVRDNHRDWYLHLAERVEPELHRDEARWTELLDVEHDNLRAAMDWSMGGEEPEAGARLAAALWWFWFLRGYFTEGRERLRSAFSAGNRVSSSVRAKALYRSAFLAFLNGDHVSCERLAEESLAISKQLERNLDIAWSLCVLGLGRPQALKRIVALEESLKLFRESDDAFGRSCAAEFLGASVLMRGDYERAKALQEEALALRKQLGGKITIAYSLLQLARVAEKSNELQAEALYEEGIALYSQVGERRGVAAALIHLGFIAIRRSQYARAEKLLGEGLTISREHGNKQYIARALSGLGTLAAHRGDYERAMALCREALIVCRGSRDNHGVFVILTALASAESLAERPRRAALLYGAVEALTESELSLLVSQRGEYEQRMTSIRAVLDDETLGTLQQQGRAMTLEQVIDYALSE